MKLPRDIGPIHFVGIGGIGMSGTPMRPKSSATSCSRWLMRADLFDDR